MSPADIAGLVFMAFLVGFLTGGAVMRNIHRGEWKDEDQ